MRKQKAIVILLSFFCVGMSVTRAQYPPPPPYAPPPPGYVPAPPGYAPAPPPPYAEPPPPPPAAYFPPGAGPYFRLGAGPSIFQDGTLRQFGGPVNTRVSYDVGVAVDGSFGYAFDKFFSVDFESGYIEAQIRNVPGFFAHGTTVANVPLLVNGTLSLPIPHTCIVPYIGGGAGGAVSIFDGHDFNDGVEFVEGEESDAVFVYQAFAGVRFRLDPNVSVGLGYKYFATANTTYSYPPSPNLNVGLSGVQTHSILFTLQVNF